MKHYWMKDCKNVKKPKRNVFKDLLVLLNSRLEP